MTATHSLNLLPTEDHTRVGYKRLTRYLIVCGSGIAFLLVIGTILLLPTYFFLFFQNHGISELITAQRQVAESAQARQVETRIQRVNDALQRLQTDLNKTQKSVTRHLESIIAITPDGITFSSISFEKGTGRIILQGRAARRNDFLQLASAIRANPLFRDVESPVENILRESNVSFTLSFTADM